MELTRTQQWAYILDQKRPDHSEELVRAIEDIHEYEDNPMYKEECDQNWKDYIQRMATLARIKEENVRDPAKRVHSVLNKVIMRYGLPQNESEGTNANVITNLAYLGDC